MSGRVVGGRAVSGRVVVVGDLVTDVLAVLAGPLAPGSDTPARVRTTGGGQAANTAAWLARSGVPVVLVATVGDDPAGRDRVAELTAAGVDCAVRYVPDVPTGTLVVLSDGQERTMLTDRGAADRLLPADVDAALARYPDAVHVHLSGYALLGDGSRAAGRHALAAAAAHGLTTSADAASAAPLRRVGAAAFRDWVGGVDLLLANAAEADALDAGPGSASSGEGGATGGEPGSASGGEPGGTLAGVAGAVVIKRGAAGARWLGDPVREVAPPPVAAVDPTGAGDAFAAGLLAAWLAGADPLAALRAGIRLGTEAVTNPGARPRPAHAPPSAS